MRYKKLRRLSIHSEFGWRYLCNAGQVLAYRLRRHPRLSGEPARVLEDLHRHGIAITSVDDLLGPASRYRELAEAVDRLEQEHGPELEAARRAGQEETQKDGLYEFFGKTPAVEMNSIYARFALQEPVRLIADGYYQMKNWLRYYNIWHNFVTDAEPRQSQSWHRDPEDRYILKMFLLLSDVDEGSGPITYAAGSHMKAAHRHRELAAIEKQGLADAEMAHYIPAEQWVKGTGARGTIIFVDTRGYHKSAYGRQKDHIMFASQFLAY